MLLEENPSMKPKSSGTSSTTSTVAKPVKVNDAKLGVFLADVVKALNANISSLSERSKMILKVK